MKSAGRPTRVFSTILAAAFVLLLPVFASLALRDFPLNSSIGLDSVFVSIAIVSMVLLLLFAAVIRERERHDPQWHVVIGRLKLAYDSALPVLIFGGCLGLAMFCIYFLFGDVNLKAHSTWGALNKELFSTYYKIMIPTLTAAAGFEFFHRKLSPITEVASLLEYLAQDFSNAKARVWIVFPALNIGHFRLVTGSTGGRFKDI